MSLIEHLHECHLKDCVRAYRRAVPWDEAMTARVQAVLDAHDGQATAIPELAAIYSDYEMETLVN